MPQRIFVALLLAAAAVGCNDETTTYPGPVIALETEVPDSDQIEASVDEGEAGIARGTRSSSTSPAELGGLGAVPAEATPGIGVDLYRSVAGGSTTIEFDIDVDGAVETVHVFQATAGPTFLAWTEAAGAEQSDRCYLTFASQGVGWYFAADCGADGALVCRHAPEMTCVLCDAEYCAPCTSDATDPRKVSCEEVVHPVEDVGVDTGPDVSEDTSEDTGEFDTIEDTGVSDTMVDTGSDVPTTDSPCSAECMSFSGAECCTGCGCTGGSGECLPVCEDSAFTWDCEIQCCFNYETFQCEGESPQ